MGILLSNCLKGIHNDFPLTTPYRRTSGRKAQLQSLLSNKSNPDVDGRKLSQPPPLPHEQGGSGWGRPSTLQGGMDDSPGPPTPGSGSSFVYGRRGGGGGGGVGGGYNPMNNYGGAQSQGTTTGPPNTKDRPRKVSFNFHQSSAAKTERENNYM